jgi:hypothetical protein
VSGRVRAAALASVAAGTAAFGLGTGTASAALVQRSASFTYTDFAGDEVVCRIASAQQFDPERDDAASASTFVGGMGECSGNAFVVIEATFVTPLRQPASGIAAGWGEALGRWEPVGDDLRTEHRVSFEGCDPEASLRCDYEVTLVQPK